MKIDPIYWYDTRNKPQLVDEYFSDFADFLADLKSIDSQEINKLLKHYEIQTYNLNGKTRVSINGH